MCERKIYRQLSTLILPRNHDTSVKQSRLLHTSQWLTGSTRFLSRRRRSRLQLLQGLSSMSQVSLGKTRSCATAFCRSRIQRATLMAILSSIGDESKSTTHGHEHIRFPKPSEDPADPLNWPIWRKHASLLVMALYSFVSNFTASNIAPALQMWPLFFPQDIRPFPVLSRLIAVSFILSSI